MPSAPSISVVIPVLNEAVGIDALLGHLRSLAGSREVEIVVVDGDPAGSTIAAVRHAGVVTLTAPPGRALQMNAGAARATGSVLLFLHADTRLPGGAFAAVRGALQAPDRAAGCFELGIDSPAWYFRITERYVALRTRVTRIPFGDQAIFMRREYFERIGGYRPIPIMEDVELMRRIRAGNDALCIVADKVMTSARRWEKEGVLYTTLRNWMLQLLYLAGVPPERLARFYR